MRCAADTISTFCAGVLEACIRAVAQSMTSMRGRPCTVVLRSLQIRVGNGGIGRIDVMSNE